MKEHNSALCDYIYISTQKKHKYFNQGNNKAHKVHNTTEVHNVQRHQIPENETENKITNKLVGS